MALTVHLFGTQEGPYVVTHCGIMGRRLMTTRFQPSVTCRECKRPGPPRKGTRPPLAPVGEPDPETIDADDE